MAVYPRTGFDIVRLRRELMEECKSFPSLYVLDEAESGADRLTLEDTDNHFYDIEILDAPLVDISSTEIRDGIMQGHDMSEYLM